MRLTRVVTYVAGILLPMRPGWTEIFWWARQDLNLGPTDYESAALTAELRAPRVKIVSVYAAFWTFSRESLSCLGTVWGPKLD